MKRGGLVLVLGLVVGLAAHLAYFHSHRPFDPESLDGQLAWMKSELQLSDAQFARIRELHEASSPRLRSLAAQVAQMQSEFAAFENTRRTSDRVDFIEFSQFVELRRNISLVQASASEMTPAQRDHYFGIVAATTPQAATLTN
jgi:hypothetical protein